MDFKFDFKSALNKKRDERERMQREIEERKNRKKPSEYVLKPQDGDKIKVIPIKTADGFTDELVVDRYRMNRRLMYSPLAYGYSNCAFKDKKNELASLGVLYGADGVNIQYKKFLPSERHFMLAVLIERNGKRVTPEMKFLDMSRTTSTMYFQCLEAEVNEGVNPNDIMNNLDESYLFDFGAVQKSYNGISYNEVTSIRLTRNKVPLNFSDDFKQTLLNSQLDWSTTVGSLYGLYLEKHKVVGQTIMWNDSQYKDGQFIELGTMDVIANFHVALALNELYDESSSDTSDTSNTSDGNVANENSNQSVTAEQQKLIDDFKKSLNL